MNRSKILTGISALACVIISTLLLTQFSSYRQTVIGQQQTQLLSMAKFASSVIEVELDRHSAGLKAAASDQEQDLAGYLEANTDLEGVYLLDRDGTICAYRGADDITPERENLIVTTEKGERTLLWLTSETQDGQILSAAVNLNLFYDRYILNDRLETKGYVAVKDSAGYVIMYPEKSELGLHTLDGRKAAYPEYDLSELESVVTRQLNAEEGVAEYHSYWWEGDTATEKSRKVSAFTPLSIGDDFWVVSVVMDYQELAGTIFTSLSYMVYLLVIFIFAFALALSFIVRARRKRAEYIRETQYLRELNATYEELAQNRRQIDHYQKLQTVGSLTSGIAHEFNNFLTPIVGYSALIMEEYPEGSQTHSDAEAIYHAGLMAQELTGQISALSHREDASKKLEKVVVGPFLTGVMKTVRVVAPSNVVVIGPQTDIPGYLYGTETGLNQIVMNLVSNALQAMEGGGMLTVAAGQAVGEQGEHILQFSVSDTGTGMDSETLDSIFDPFFTTKGSGRGLGLGLAMVQRIVHDLSGRLEVESTPGSGSTFTVSLPLYFGEVAAADAEDIRSETAELRILVVDDDVKVLDFLKRGLGKRGHHVDILEAPGDALALFRENPGGYDLLISDNMMSGMTGLELARQMKRIRPDFSIILITALMTTDIISARDQGLISAALSKPVTVAQLIEAFAHL